MKAERLQINGSEIPEYVARWFADQGWHMRDYQRRMFDHAAQNRDVLLIAPTGAGKTLSGFLPSLIDIHETAASGLHTLYLSPLKALTHDIERNLLSPIEQMGLKIRVESRTGDTPASKRLRQRLKPPHLLLTTPESLMLMLSYPEARQYFSSLKAVIIDEVHSLAPSKRGDFTALALAQLRDFAPEARRIGLSATVADPQALSQWLGGTHHPAWVEQVRDHHPPEVTLLEANARIPFGGFMARYAMPAIYQALQQARHSIVFVNTRAQAELVFQMLWDVNTDALPIAVYHGSLEREQRRRTEAMMAEGKLRAVVATSALELGIDWGDVDLVVQIGAPKGVSRLLQRIGRSNHRLDTPSRAMLVPSNRFELLECEAALRAMAAGQRDAPHWLGGSLDVLVQFLVNCACSEPVEAAHLYAVACQAMPYAGLSRSDFDAALACAWHGGYRLKDYEHYQRLMPNEQGQLVMINPRMMRRHRQNIGTIVEAARLKVKRLNQGKGGRILGEVEEYFAQQLSPGDTFYFGGEVLAYERIHDMVLEARPAQAKEPKIPSFVGGQMPLSTFLAEGVRHLLHHPEEWQALPTDIVEWLALQQQFSLIPRPNRLLIEHFPKFGRYFTLFYTFEGRKVNQTLGFLMTRRMERLGLEPLSFSITDYGLSIASLQPLVAKQMDALLTPELLGDDLEEWLAESPMLKRAFRQVATIAGLTGQQDAGTRKTMRQMTVSTDLIYDVLRRYEPDHLLLAAARSDAQRELLDIPRLSDWLQRYSAQVDFVVLRCCSPLGIPIVLGVRSEAVNGSGVDALLAMEDAAAEAELWMQEVRDAVS